MPQKKTEEAAHVQEQTRQQNGQPSQQDEQAQITISRIEAETIRVPILGITPLIMHRFSEKAKKKMLDAAQGRSTPKTSQASSHSTR